MQFLAALVVAILILGGPAAAHHVMDGQMPATALQGLLSGLGHPIIGLDHFAALVALGGLAAVRGRGLLVHGFVLAMLVGVVGHILELTVPGAEMLVALSLILLGTALALGHGMTPCALLGLVAGAGLVHGYALGESIVGAERTPLLAYLVGLAVIQAALSLAVMAGGRLLLSKAGEMVPRVAGAAVLLAGVVLLGVGAMAA